MEQLTPVLIHESRYPGRVQEAYLESFRTRRMNHQFHYDTEKQAQLWLKLHEAYSPARRDEDCSKTYAAAFDDLGKTIMSRPLTVVSLGCGGGQKDLELLNALKGEIVYGPTDVSLTLALTAHLAAAKQGIVSKPAVLDLAKTTDLDEIITRAGCRLFAFFGMLPNFEPEDVLPQISRALGESDFLLLSANLAPGGDVERILPQYDNDLTRRWLAAVLLDAGIQMHPGEIEFRIEEVAGIHRIVASYRFKNDQKVRIGIEEFVFKTREDFRLFFSYRHTPKLLRELMGRFAMEVKREWIANSDEEGVFLLAKRKP